MSINIKNIFGTFENLRPVRKKETNRRNSRDLCLGMHNSMYNSNSMRKLSDSFFPSKNNTIDNTKFNQTHDVQQAK